MIINLIYEVSIMKLVYKGKTKDVYQNDNGEIVLYFKDDMTGKDGVFDPGENQVGLTVEGSGRAGLERTSHFCKTLEENNIPTHYLSSDLDKKEMRVKEIENFGDGLEVICRYVAVGSYYRRYGQYIENGTILNSPVVEFTLKDDERQDPVASKETLDILGLLTNDEYDKIEQLTIQLSNIIKEELLKKDLELYDIKLEFGKDKETDDIYL